MLVQNCNLSCSARGWLWVDHSHSQHMWRDFSFMPCKIPSAALSHTIASGSALWSERPLPVFRAGFAEGSFSKGHIVDVPLTAFTRRFNLPTAVNSLAGVCVPSHCLPLHDRTCVVWTRWIDRTREDDAGLHMQSITCEKYIATCNSPPQQQWQSKACKSMSVNAQIRFVRSTRVPSLGTTVRISTVERYSACLTTQLISA